MNRRMNFSYREKGLGFISIVLVILCCSLCGLTLAFFHESDWASSTVNMSGKVQIEAVGAGNESIEDTYIESNLVIDLDKEYKVLIPGMPLSMPANVKVYQSTTKPLLRAKLGVEIYNTETIESSEDDKGVVQNMFGQLSSIIQSNHWYLHSDSYYYYVGSGAQLSGGNTKLKEVDVVASPVVVDFIDEDITFPEFVTSTYSGLGVRFVIKFQAIQNFIPDSNGARLDNTIDNSLKIFNSIQPIVPQTPNISMPTIPSEPVNPDPPASDMNLFDVTVDNKGQVTISFKEDVEYPETLVLPTEDANGNKITNISIDSNIANVTSKTIVVPSSYTSIEAGVFQNNTTIESLDLSRTSISDIPDNCFANSSIESIVLPPTIEEIQKEDFGGSNLKNIDLSQTVITDIPKFCFANSTLESLVLPDTIINIQAESFNGSNLNSIILPEGLEEIHSMAFSNTKVQVLEIPSTVNYISSDNIVLHSDYLEKIIVSENNPNFYDIDDICILSSVRFVKMAPLSNVTEFTIPEGVKEVAWGALYRHAKLQKINFPTTMESVKQEAFRYCAKLTTVNAKSAVNYGSRSVYETAVTDMTLGGACISKSMGYNSKLTKVTFASNVTSLEDIVLYNCSTIDTIIFESTTPPTFKTSTFISSNKYASNMKIYVPDDAVSAYKAVANLAGFVDRIVPRSQLGS